MSDVKRYDCTDGGAQFCQGCYTMTEGEYGDYVHYEDHERLERENAELRTALDALEKKLAETEELLDSWRSVPRDDQQ